MKVVKQKSDKSNVCFLYLLYPEPQSIKNKAMMSQYT